MGKHLKAYRHMVSMFNVKIECYAMYLSHQYYIIVF